MVVEGVNFIENEVVKWKRKDFIDTHKKLFSWIGKNLKGKRCWVIFTTGLRV